MYSTRRPSGILNGNGKASARDASYSNIIRSSIMAGQLQEAEVTASSSVNCLMPILVRNVSRYAKACQTSEV